MRYKLQVASVILFSLFTTVLAHADDSSYEPSKSEVAKTKEAAEHGDAAAQYKLAYLYLNGSSKAGMPIDLPEAVKWTQKAAEQNYAPAEFALALAYSDGRGVPQSDTEAVKWYRKAAGHGYLDAQFKARIYLTYHAFSRILDSWLTQIPSNKRFCTSLISRTASVSWLNCAGRMAR